MNPKLGCHVSITGNVDKAFDRAKIIGCETFQIFLKSPRMWRLRIFNEKEVANFKAKSKTYSIAPIIGHISYLPNLASQNEEIYKKSIHSFVKEIKLCKLLEIPYLVIHSGSYKGNSFEKGFVTYISSIMKGIEAAEGKIMLLVENTGSTKNSLTAKFEHIEKVLNEINDKKSVGTCFDTCHAYAAGYDLSTARSVNKTLEDIESTFGTANIHVIHANDTIGELGSNLDRHEHVGLGKIGKEGFETLINHNLLRNKPWILETPIDERRDDRKNIDYLRGLCKK